MDVRAVLEALTAAPAGILECGGSGGGGGGGIYYIVFCYMIA